jgi:hypothetical protein
MARQHRVVDHVEHLIPIDLDRAICEYHLTAPRALLTRIMPLPRGHQSGTTHACVAVAVDAVIMTAFPQAGDFAGAAPICWWGRN